MIRPMLAAVLLAFAASVATATPAEPLKPVDQVVDEVVAFLHSDVGIDGIRTNDDDPEGYPVPPYFYHYAIKDLNGLWSGGGGYPGYDAVSYPAYTASVGIDAFLAHWRYTGSTESLDRAVAYADWILDHLTPAGDLYARVPYSTQTDAIMGGGWDGEAIELDKPPMFGLRLLDLYDITGDPRYLAAADTIAATMAATQMAGPVADDGRWPFRARPSDGLVTQDYTSHLTPAVLFLEAMGDRLGDPTLTAASQRAWSWLLANPCSPGSPSYQRWEAFYEDQSPEMQTGFRDHYSAHEMIIELVQRRPAGWQATAVDIMDWVRATYLIDGDGTEAGIYWPSTYEWSGWYHATFASTMQFAYAAQLLYQALDGDPLQDTELDRLSQGMVLVCTHGQNDRGIAEDGRMHTTLKDIWAYLDSTSWYEQNFNTVKYMIAFMGLDPSWAPVDEDHLLRWTSPIVSIEYGGAARVAYSTLDDAGFETFKLASAPGSVLVGGMPLPQLASDDGATEGWTWDAATQLCTVRHGAGPVEIVAWSTDVPPAAASAFRLLPPSPNPANPAVTLTVELDAAATVRLDVLDVRGRVVRTVLDADLPAGSHSRRWDGRDDAGRECGSGRYVARLSAGGVVSSRVVTLVR